MASERADINNEVFDQLNIGPDSRLIYLYLLEKGSDSVLGISKANKLPRTRVYRNLDKLREMNLVVETAGELGAKFRAAPPQQLVNMLDKRAEELDEIREQAPKLVKYLEGLLSLGGGKDTEVNYYKGIDGLKQMTWNSLAAEGELMIYEIADMNAFLDRKFAEKVRQEIVLRQIQVKQLTNKIELADWTDVSLATKHLQVRHVPIDQLEIQFEILIYNDTLAMYTYSAEEVWGVEIKNSILSRMQKQLFSFVWMHARPLQMVGEKGWAKLVLDDPIR